MQWVAQGREEAPQLDEVWCVHNEDVKLLQRSGLHHTCGTPARQADLHASTEVSNYLHHLPAEQNTGQGHGSHLRSLPKPLSNAWSSGVAERSISVCGDQVSQDTSLPSGIHDDHSADSSTGASSTEGVSTPCDHLPPLVLAKRLPSVRCRIAHSLRDDELLTVTRDVPCAAHNAAVCPTATQTKLLTAYAHGCSDTPQNNSAAQAAHTLAVPPPSVHDQRRLTGVYHHLGAVSSHEHRPLPVGDCSVPSSIVGHVVDAGAPKGCYTIRHYMQPVMDEVSTHGTRSTVTPAPQPRPQAMLPPCPPMRTCHVSGVVIPAVQSSTPPSRNAKENAVEEQCQVMTCPTVVEAVSGDPSIKTKSGRPKEIKHFIEDMPEWGGRGLVTWYYAHDVLPVCWQSLLARDECESREAIMEEECYTAIREIPFDSAAARHTHGTTHFYKTTGSSSEGEYGCHRLHPALEHGIMVVTLREADNRQNYIDEEIRESLHFPKEAAYLRRVAVTGSTLKIERFLRNWVAKVRGIRQLKQKRLMNLCYRESDCRQELLRSDLCHERYELLRGITESLEQYYRTSLEMTHLRASLASAFIATKMNEQVARFTIAFGAPMSRARLCGRTDAISLFRSVVLCEELDRKNSLVRSDAFTRVQWRIQAQYSELEATESCARRAICEEEDWRANRTRDLLTRLVVLYTLRDDETYEAVERNLSLYGPFHRPKLTADPKPIYAALMQYYEQPCAWSGSESPLTTSMREEEDAQWDVKATTTIAVGCTTDLSVGVVSLHSERFCWDDQEFFDLPGSQVLGDREFARQRKTSGTTG